MRSATIRSKLKIHSKQLQTPATITTQVSKLSMFSKSTRFQYKLARVWASYTRHMSQIKISRQFKKPRKGVIVADLAHGLSSITVKSLLNRMIFCQ